MNDDTTSVRQLLTAADPVPAATELAADARLVRQRVSTSRPARWHLQAVAAAIVVLLAVGATVPFLRPASAWASETTARGDTLVTIEMTEFYRRGHDPGPLVAELRRHGVEVEVVDRTDLTPWKHGRVVSVTFSIALETPQTPPFFGNPSSEQAQRALFDSHGILPDNGRYTIAAERFDGSLTIGIGRFPGTGAGHDA
jgi:anti-sigma factor RsiW